MGLDKYEKIAIKERKEFHCPRTNLKFFVVHGIGPKGPVEVNWARYSPDESESAKTDSTHGTGQEQMFNGENSLPFTSDFHHRASEKGSRSSVSLGSSSL